MTDSKRTEMGGTGWPTPSALLEEKEKGVPSNSPTLLARGFRRQGDRSQPPMSLPILPRPMDPSPLAQAPVTASTDEPLPRLPEVPSETPEDPWKIDYTHWASLFLMVAIIAFVFVLLLSFLFWLVARVRGH